MNMRSQAFNAFFENATGDSPFAFQQEFARTLPALPALVSIPTGLGKTAMAVVGWLWGRFGGDEALKRSTPRRLVYCLPMRVLVEQTAKNASAWVRGLKDKGRIDKNVSVHVLMGGEDEEDWDLHPEREAIIIGTQDMLLSRALNRGYAASRSRWPMQFGLLHTDCLWVFDEIQLMGSGLATTAQLEAFRRLLPEKGADSAKNGSDCRSVWMSATLRHDWLKTVDFKDRIDDQGRIDGCKTLSLTSDNQESEQVKKRWEAKKPLAKAKAIIVDLKALAKEIRQAHENGTRTIVVVNTVKRACALYEALKKELTGTVAAGAAGGKRTGRSPSVPAPDVGAALNEAKPNLVLLHSRFRPNDRKKRIDEALAGPPPEGTIVVSTQVIEAGVDVSATTLFTELVPWASLVQRFGRCNRRGEQNEYASVRWIDLPAKDTDAKRLRLPYELADLRAAAEELNKLKDVGLESLDAHKQKLSEKEKEALFPHEHSHVIRRKDLIDLFDTTPDLAGNDIDIDRFVREVDDSDARVFWRTWDQDKTKAPPEDEPAPQREELCPVPVGEFRDFARKHGGRVWRWDFLDRKWENAEAASIVPGQVFLVHPDEGGYTPERGWDAGSRTRVEPVRPPHERLGDTPDATDEDQPSRIGVWQTIAEHTDAVCHEVGKLLGALPLSEARAEALRHATRWHDWGKAHPVFRAALPDGIPDATKVWAKAAGQWKRYARRHFRHELASALAVLDPRTGRIPDELRDLVAYLVAAHHGKVRLSIRSLPNELRPRDGHGNPELQKRFARGVWDDDLLPETDLGDRVIAPEVRLSLEPMELGLCQHPPFEDQPSWAERMIRLRDTLGPFRLAYLEAILRAADIRASKAAEQHGAENQQAGATTGRKGAGHD